ncbi:hypothetical protein SRABI128_03917 [Microbacterium sp. Bi128]|nr:hypothetical protein SRABI128_03917 [Microbacterium sp. Bi128]
MRQPTARVRPRPGPIRSATNRGRWSPRPRRRSLRRTARRKRALPSAGTPTRPGTTRVVGARWRGSRPPAAAGDAVPHPYVHRAVGLFGIGRTTPKILFDHAWLRPVSDHYIDFINPVLWSLEAGGVERASGGYSTFRRRFPFSSECYLHRPRARPSAYLPGARNRPGTPARAADCPGVALGSSHVARSIPGRTGQLPGPPRHARPAAAGHSCRRRSGVPRLDARAALRASRLNREVGSRGGPDGHLCPGTCTAGRGRRGLVSRGHRTLPRDDDGP